MNSFVCCEEAGDLTGNVEAIEAVDADAIGGYKWIQTKDLIKYDIIPKVRPCSESKYHKLCRTRISSLFTDYVFLPEIFKEDLFNKYMNMLTVGRFGKFSDYKYERLPDVKVKYDNSTIIDTYVVCKLSKDDYTFIITSNWDPEHSEYARNPDKLKLGFQVRDDLMCSLLYGYALS